MSKELDSLFKAIRKQDKNLVREILGGDQELINATDVDNWGAIHICAAGGNREIMKILIEEFGADVNQRMAYLYTPLHVAAKHKNVDCLIELMTHDADPTLTDRASCDVVSFLGLAEPKLGLLLGDLDDNCHLELKKARRKIIFNSHEHDIQYVISH